MNSRSSRESEWVGLSDEALTDEIRSNRRTERRLMLVVGLVATACTVVVLLLHGAVS